MSYMTVGDTPVPGSVAPGTGGYTLLGKSNCVNASGVHVATTKCAGQPISSLPVSVAPSGETSVPKIILIGGALAVAAGVGYLLLKRKRTP